MQRHKLNASVGIAWIQSEKVAHSSVVVDGTITESHIAMRNIHSTPLHTGIWLRHISIMQGYKKVGRKGHVPGCEWRLQKQTRTGCTHNHTRQTSVATAPCRAGARRGAEAGCEWRLQKQTLTTCTHNQTRQTSVATAQIKTMDCQAFLN